MCVKQAIVKKSIYLVTPSHYAGVFVKVSKTKTTIFKYYQKEDQKITILLKNKCFAWQRGGPCS